jgi:hypothetical protein
MAENFHLLPKRGITLNFVHGLVCYSLLLTRQELVVSSVRYHSICYLKTTADSNIDTEVYDAVLYGLHRRRHF